MKCKIQICAITICVCAISLGYATPLGWRDEDNLPCYSDAPHLGPHVVTSSPAIHVISASDGGDTRCYEVEYNRSTDTGVHWDHKWMIDTYEYTVGGQFPVDIAVNGSTVHAVYELVRPSSRHDIKYAKSVDGGATWPDSLKTWISDAQNASAHPAIALKNNDTIYVVWADWRHNKPSPNDTVEIYFARSNNGGANWS